MTESTKPSTLLRRLSPALLAAASTLLFTACGSDDDDVVTPVDPTPPSNQVPASALESSAAYTQYVGSLAATENGLPVYVGNVGIAPSSDTAAPQPL